MGDLQVQLPGALKVAWSAAPLHLAQTTLPSKAVLPKAGGTIAVIKLYLSCLHSLLSSQVNHWDQPWPAEVLQTRATH